MSDLIGRQVKILAGPCAGATGMVTEVKRAVSGAFTGEFRVAFSPAVHVKSVGSIEAIWRKPTDLEVIRERGQANA